MEMRKIEIVFVFWLAMSRMWRHESWRTTEDRWRAENLDLKINIFERWFNAGPKHILKREVVMFDQ